MQLQPAVKKETIHIAWGTALGSMVMLLVFWLLNLAVPEAVPFDYRVVLSACLGSLVAIGNFFLMGLTVQQIVSGSQEKAPGAMRGSYRFRTWSQLVWVVLALALPVFNGAAGIIPLFFPSITIKLMGIQGFSDSKSDGERS